MGKYQTIGISVITSQRKKVYRVNGVFEVIKAPKFPQFDTNFKLMEQNILINYKTDNPKAFTHMCMHANTYTHMHTEKQQAVS